MRASPRLGRKIPFGVACFVPGGRELCLMPRKAQSVDINPLRDFRYIADEGCAPSAIRYASLDMLSYTSPLGETFQKRERNQFRKKLVWV